MKDHNWGDQRQRARADLQRALHHERSNGKRRPSIKRKVVTGLILGSFF
jgi:hypothetical protein